MQPIGSYGWAYGLPIPKMADSFERQYRDLTKDVQIKWDRVGTKVNLH